MISIAFVSLFPGSPGSPAQTDVPPLMVSATPVELWTRQFGSLGLDYAEGVALDDTGVYVAGDTSGVIGEEADLGLEDIYLRKYDRNGVELWTHQFGTDDYDFARAVAVDATGVYVAGATYGAFPGHTNAGSGSSSSSDAFLRKYDRDGVELWTDQFGTTASEYATALAVDATGVYVAGWTTGTFPGQTNSGYYDAYLRKYDHNGNALWTLQFGAGAWETYASGVAVDDTGVYVAGRADGAFSGQTNQGENDAYLRKYDCNGVELWTRQFGTDGYDSAHAVAVDATGVYIAGTTNGGLSGITNQGWYDAFLRKYDHSGRELWTYQFGTLGEDAANGLAVDANGVYVAGSTSGALPGQTHSGARDAFLRKYDRSGPELWTHQFGTSREDWAVGVAVDAMGVYVAGYTEGAFGGQTNQGYYDAFLCRDVVERYTEPWVLQFGASNHEFVITSVAVDATGVYIAGSSSEYAPTDPPPPDVLLRKYDFDGNELWTVEFGSPGEDIGLALAVDSTGVYVAGNVDGALLGQSTLGGRDAFVSKFDLNGNELWMNQFGSPENDDANALAVDSTGVYVAGTAFAALPDQPNMGHGDSYVRKYDLNGQELWTDQFGTVDTDEANAVVVDATGVYVSGDTTAFLIGEPAESRAFLRKYNLGGGALWTKLVGAGEWYYAPSLLAIDSTNIYMASYAEYHDPYTYEPIWIDVILRKFDPSGNDLWTKRYGTSSSDLPTGVAVDATGIYVVGWTYGVFPGQVREGSKDAFIGKFDFDGNELWTWQFGSWADDVPTAVATSPSAAFIVGWTRDEILGQTQVGLQDGFIIALPVFWSGPSDATPPTISVPAAITAEAQVPSGAVVEYTVTATDETDGTVAVTCTPGSGSTFPLGTTAVACTAADSAGNAGSASFPVTVVDTTAPTLAVPLDLTLEALSPQGAIVTYAVSATDAVGLTGDPVCNPASNAVFPVGDTTVACSASDSSGNVGSASFVVHVTDTTAPILVLPDDITLEANATEGSVGGFHTEAYDLVDGTVGVTCVPESGWVFPLGTTVVECSAADAHGNAAHDSFRVTVVDTKPPVVAVSGLVADSSGAFVAFTGWTFSASVRMEFTAVDLVGVASLACSLDAAPFTECSSPQGLFGLALGSHVFEVRAADGSGNEASATFAWINNELVSPPGTDTTVTTNPTGETTITSSDSTGPVVEVTLPPGTTAPGGTVTVTCESKGQNNACETTGVVLPPEAYPPGKAMKVRANPGSTKACIVDAPGSVLAEGLPRCGNTDTSISQVVLICDGLSHEFTGFPDAPTTRTYKCTRSEEGGLTYLTVEGLAFSTVITDADMDADGVLDGLDACPETAGLAAFQGCPVGVESSVVLHIVDQAKSAACPGGAGSCVSALANVAVKVFDRNLLNGLSVELLDGGTATLPSNPEGVLYDDIFESSAAAEHALAAPFGCTTDGTGSCVAGTESAGTYLVIVKWLDPRSGKTVYLGRPLGASDFVDTDADGVTDLAAKEFQVLQVIRRDGAIQISGGSKTIVRGSYLEIVYPDFAVWEDAASGFVYPFIFTSDSDWAVDVCSRVPAGYVITGVYDENGTLLGTNACVQTFVSGETKVIAFNVVDIGSPEPELVAQINLKHPGHADTALEVSVPGMRLYKDNLPLVLGTFALAVSLGLAILVPLALALAAGRVRLRGRNPFGEREQVGAERILLVEVPSVIDGDHVVARQRMLDATAEVRTLVGYLRLHGFPVDRHGVRIHRVDALLRSQRYHEALRELEDVRAMLQGYASSDGPETVPDFVRARIEAGLGPEWDELGP